MYISVNCNNLRIKSAFFQKAIKNCVNVKPAWFTLTQFIYIVFYKERGDSNAVSISLSEKQLRYSRKLESKYVYSHTERTDFTLAELGTVGIVAAIVAIVPGVAPSVIGNIVAYAVANKLHGLYIIQKVYKYWEKEDGDNYLYLKQVTSIYSKTDDSLVGGPWTNYNKFRQR